MYQFIHNIFIQFIHYMLATVVFGSVNLAEIVALLLFIIPIVLIIVIARIIKNLHLNKVSIHNWNFKTTIIFSVCFLCLFISALPFTIMIPFVLPKIQVFHIYFPFMLTFCGLIAFFLLFLIINSIIKFILSFLSKDSARRLIAQIFILFLLFTIVTLIIDRYILGNIKLKYFFDRQTFFIVYGLSSFLIGWISKKDIDKYLKTDKKKGFIGKFINKKFISEKQVSQTIKITRYIIPLLYLYIYFSMFNFYYHHTILKISLHTTSSVIVILLGITFCYLASIIGNSGIIQGINNQIKILLKNFIRILIVVIFFIFILQIWGINVTAIVGGLGISGIAIAIAAQDILKNIMAWILIGFENKFTKGQYIKINGVVEGTVEKLGFRSVAIRTLDKSLMYVPNTLFIEKPIINFSLRNIRRITLSIGLEYSTSSTIILKIRQEILNYIQSNKNYVTSQDITNVFLDEFADSSINIYVSCFTHSIIWTEWLKIKQELLLEIKTIVEKNNAGFAFPSLSVYMEKTAPEAKKQIGKDNK